ncbi:MAG: hypothetical protein ABIP63_03390 [Thermoanaerobaculia bacterium]
MLAALLFIGAMALTRDDIPGAAVPARDRCSAVALGQWNAKLLAVLRRHRSCLGIAVGRRIIQG